jgi:hypothetical protein
MPVISQADVDTLAAIVSRVQPDPVIVPPPVVPPVTGRVKLDRTVTTAVYADKVIGIKWARVNGDYLDGAGVLNGPKPTLAYTMGPGLTQTVDISKLAAPFTMSGLTGYWGGAMIDGKPADYYGVDSSTGTPIMPPNLGQRFPAFFMTGGQSLTVTTTTAQDAGTVIRLDPLVAPLLSSIPDIAWSPQPYRAPDILDIQCTSRDAIKSHMAPFNDYQPGATPDAIAFNEEYLIESTGMPYVRFSTSTPPAMRLISWFLRFQPRDEVYIGFDIYIEDDVAAADVQGIKLCGLGCVPAQSGFPSFTAEYAVDSTVNPGWFPLVGYRYDAQGDQMNDYTNVIARAGRWGRIELGARLNSSPDVADGWQAMKYNGNLVMERKNVKIRTGMEQQYAYFHGQVYHGGMVPPTGPMHFRLANIGVSSQWIGTPPLLPRS